MKKTASLISLLLILMTLVSLMGIYAHAQESDTPPSFDFSDGNSSYRAELTPAELLSLLMPKTYISDAEKRYINSYSDCVFLINDGFSNDTLRIRREKDTLSVEAREYSYTAANGTSVRWIPELVRYGESSAPLSDDANGDYLCELSYKEEITHVSVSYFCSVSVPASDAAYLLNFAYREAVAGDELERQYSSVLGEYMERFRQYEEALAALEQYELDLESYEKYLVLRAEYEEELTEYTKYLSELAEYEKKLAEHEQYLKAYDQYLKDKAEYERIYSENIGSMDEYVAYYTRLNKIRQTMYAIENIYTKPREGLGTLYKALQNKELVAMFDKYKDELTIYGIEKKTIEALSDIADDLNELLREYNDARSLSEQAAFDFYVENYADICYMFNYLYDSMMKIMTPTIFNHICILINTEYDPEMAQYKKWRITNVLAHIYLVSRCLDDNVSAEGAWHFFDYERNEHTYYFPELLTPAVTISDTNAANPTGLIWPDNPPDFTLPPVPVEPTKVAKPLAPEYMDAPKAPETVTEPTPPPEPVYPGDPPKGLEELTRTAEIVSALREGSLTKRALPTEPLTLSFTHTVKKLVSPDGLPVMTVYGYDKKTVISEAIISSPEGIIFPVEAPERASDKKYNYSFLGWSLSPDEMILPDAETLFSSDSDFCIYAAYRAEDRLYSVRWITPSGEFTESYKYGETPTFGGNTEKEQTNTTVYSFDGWSPPVERVTEDAEYTAKYLESERKYTVVWKLRDKTLSEKYSYGAIPQPPSVTPYYVVGCDLFEFNGWSADAGAPITADIRLEAIYSKKPLAVADGEQINLESRQSVYRLTVAGSSASLGELISLAAKENKRIEIVFDNATLTFDNTSVKTLATRNAEKISVEYSLDGGQGECTLSVKDKHGADVRVTCEMRLRIPYASALPENFTVYERVKDAKKETPYTFDGGYLTFPVNGTSSFVFTRLYKVSISESEHGGTIADGYLHEAGDKLSLLFYPERGYLVGKITVTRSDNGSSLVIDTPEGFIMPDCDVTVTVSFERIRYTVSFVVKGETVSSEKYYLGDMPAIPDVPTEYEEDGYKYVFAGWSETVSAVTHDTVYYAKYNSFLIDMQSSGQQTGNELGAFIKFTVIPIAAIALIVIALAVLLAVFLRKRSKLRGKTKATKKKKQ